MKRDEIAMRGGRILLILQVCGWVGIALDLNHENERFFFEEVDRWHRMPGGCVCDGVVRREEEWLCQREFGRVD